MFDLYAAQGQGGWWCSSSTDAMVQWRSRKPCMLQPQAAGAIAGGSTTCLHIVQMRLIGRTGVAIEDEARHSVAQSRVAGDRNGKVEAEGN